MNNNNLYINWERSFIDKVKKAIKSTKRKFNIEDAIDEGNHLANDYDKVMIEYYRFIKRHPFSDNDFNKYLVAYKKGNRLEDKYFKYDLNLLYKYYEKIDEDPVFYKQFSELIEEAIKDFEEGRISEAQYLEKVVKHRNDFVSGQGQEIPSNLNNKPQARAFYGAVKDVLKRTKSPGNLPNNEKALADIGEGIEKIIEKLTIRDWKRNTDIQKEMKNEVEDYLLEKQEDLNLEITFEEIDEVFDLVLKIAKSNF